MPCTISTPLPNSPAAGFRIPWDGWMDGWMDGWTDGWMDGWMDYIMIIWVIPKIGMVLPPKLSILIGFSWLFHYKPSILGQPYFWKHPYVRINYARKNRCSFFPSSLSPAVFVFWWESTEIPACFFIFIFFCWFLLFFVGGWALFYSQDLAKSFCLENCCPRLWIWKNGSLGW